MFKVYIFNCIQLETAARLQQLDAFTENSDLEPTEVIVSVAVLLTAPEEVSGNISVSQKI